MVRSYAGISKTFTDVIESFIIGKKKILQEINQDSRDSLASFQSLSLSIIEISLEILITHDCLIFKVSVFIVFVTKGLEKE